MISKMAVKNNYPELYSIDNSALNNILNNSVKSEKLKNLILKRNIVLVIPFETFVESVAGGMTDLIHTRLSRLFYIMEEVGFSRIFISRGTMDWLRRELKVKGRLRTIPSYLNSPRWGSFAKILREDSELKEFHRSIESSLEDDAFSKVNLAKMDSEFRKAAFEKFCQDDIRAYIAAILSSHKSIEAIVFAPSFKFLLNRRRLRRVLKTKNRYSHLKLYLCLLALRTWGNCLNDFFENDEFGLFEEIKRGNWFDLACISISLKMNGLVTDDEDQFNFAELCYRHGLIQAIPIKSNNFLNFSH